jgi:HlyD family secretion protein
MNTPTPTLILKLLLAAGVVLALAVARPPSVHAADDKAAPSKDAPKAALTVSLTQAQRSTWATGVSANGNIVAWQEAIVGAEGNGMRLAEVRVNVGDVVKRGQVLATFVADMAQADLAQAQASVAEAEANLAEAASNAQRARDLQASGALSAQQINQYLTGETTAKARLQAQRAMQKVQQLRLSHAQVLAPDNGVISARAATVGAVVPAGMELFRLIRQGKLEWRAEVAAAELAQVKPGQSVKVLPAGGTAITGQIVGQVRMVAPTVDATTRNGMVFVDLPLAAAAAAGAKAGMFARGDFEVGSSNAVTLPQSAVLLRDGYSYVFKVGADNKVTQTKVAVGRRVGDRIEVTGGLDPATRVVASGGGFLADGDTVKVVAGPVVAPVVAPAAAPVANK